MQRDFDIVFSLNIPKMSGLELLKEIRRTHPHAAFVVATGVRDVNMGVLAMKQGADDYLVKPMEFSSGNGKRRSSVGEEAA